jgi:hypothetical protein
MNKIQAIFFTFFVTNAFFLGAQNINLTTFNTKRVRDTKTDMLILGGWAVGNMAVSGLMLRNTEGGVAKGYHQMNIGWNAVNLAIAGFGYMAAAKSDPSSFDLFGTVNEHYKMQKVFLFNAGLDVGYIAGGAWLMERSKTTSKNQERTKGFGRAIIVNGAFLFVFDLANYFIRTKQDAALKLLLKNDGLGFSWHF